MRRVARIHLRSTVKNVSHSAIELACLQARGGRVGMGWGLWRGKDEELTYADYADLHGHARGPVSKSVALLRALPEGTLLWTRDQHSDYWLGEITGPWRYRENEMARTLDLFCTRDCDWWRMGPEDVVPGKIVNNFRAPVTLNMVRDAAARRYSGQLHASATGALAHRDRPTSHEVVTSLLGAEDLEDLVSVYLQVIEGMVVVARGRSTPGYECVLRRRNGSKAVVSVKSGGATVDPRTMPTNDVERWAYAVSGVYEPADPRLRVVRTEELVGLIESHPQVLPDRVRRWIES